MVWTLSATSAAILFDRNLTERVTDVHAHASVYVRLKQKWRGELCRGYKEMKKKKKRRQEKPEK